jgi:hypothetical protein
VITTWLEPSSVPHPRRALLRGLGARRAAPLHVAIVEHEEAGVTPAARGAAARLGDVDRVAERRRSRVRGYSGPRTVATSGSVHGNTSSRWTARAPARGDTLDGDGRAEREVDIAGDSVQRRRSAGTRASRPQGRVAAGRSIGAAPACAPRRPERSMEVEVRLLCVVAEEEAAGRCLVGAALVRPGSAHALQSSRSIPAIGSTTPNAADQAAHQPRHGTPPPHPPSLR